MTDPITGYYSKSSTAESVFRASVELVDAFAALTGDRSSLHTDEAYAATTMYRRRVAHGMLPLSFLPLCPGIVPPGAQARLIAISGHFAGPVYVDDEVRVSTKFVGADGAVASLEYRVDNVTTGQSVANGSFSMRLSDRPGAAKEQSVAARDAALKQAPVDEMDERVVDIAEIGKGDVESFEFELSADSVQRFFRVCGQAMVREPATGEDASAGRFEPAELFATMLYSTFVGMRIPGRLATFVDFDIRMDAAVAFGRRYLFRGEVKHVSRGARLIRAATEIAETGGPVVAQGSIVSLVNELIEARSSIDSLRTRFADPGLASKVVLITGASGGIGETTAKLFAIAGARVIVNYRRKESDAERIVREIEADGGEAMAVAADVADPEQVRAMVDKAVQRFGQIDILVNNAARNFDAIAYEDLTWDQIQSDLDVALRGAFNCVKAVSPFMLSAGGGKIVNVSSVYAIDPPKDQLKYVISKAALDGLTRGLAAEFAGRNIQVNSVVPSFVDTETASRMHAGIRRRKAKEAAAGRNAKPEEVAQAIIFLASSHASYTTGQRLLVTGGGSPYL